jgi:hypothetical protein
VGRYLREEGWEGRPRPRRGIAAGEAGCGSGGGGGGFGCGRGESARVVETGEELSCRVVRRLSSANGIKVGWTGGFPGRSIVATDDPDPFEILHLAVCLPA